jgi:midasin
MAEIDVSRQRASLLSDSTTVQLLPPEILQHIQHHKTDQLLDAVASAARLPQLTGRIFVHFEGVFPDICARWLSSSRTEGSTTARDIICSFARILPFAPYLSTFLDEYLHHLSQKKTNTEGVAFDWHFDLYPLIGNTDSLLQFLVALWRLNSFDRRRYSGLSRPSQIQALFHHASAAVRYLAIRVFCQLHDAADAKLEDLLKAQIEDGDDLVADFDGRRLDFTFLSLHEHTRAQEIQSLRSRAHEEFTNSIHGQVLLQELTPYVLRYGCAVLPRPSGPTNTPSSLIHTPTTTENLEKLALLMKSGKPILLHGLSGSGKTSLVRELAQELGKEANMVTLHLNDQTDAKVLIGLYATGSKPGSFQWRSGVLTTAVREGRWVLIEDLDRAPTEVMSTLLPLIERGDLLLPSRGERIQAADGFRIFATIRTSIGTNDKESLPNMIGMRLWQLLSVKPLPQKDLEHIIKGTHPRLHHYTGEIISVFNQLISATTGANRFSLGRGVGERPISTRDLLKWCRRLDAVLEAAGCISGNEPVSETTRDRMFMEAIECFVSSIKESSTQQILVSNIAKEMCLSADRVDHYMKRYSPDMQDLDLRLVVGRVQFNKRKRSSRITKPRRPFASTRHARRLLEQISVSVKQREPVLLVGETGIGKTTVVQQLADSLGHKLVAINLSQQSEVGDLLGGFKPVSARSLAMPLKEEFDDLFERTGVSADKNKDYLDRISKKFARGRWSEVSKEWRKAPKMFTSILSKIQQGQKSAQGFEDAGGHPAKRNRAGKPFRKPWISSIDRFPLAPALLRFPLSRETLSRLRETETGFFSTRSTSLLRIHWRASLTSSIPGQMMSLQFCYPRPGKSRELWPIPTLGYLVL